jgi:DNA polymerase-3 subunit beta
LETDAGRLRLSATNLEIGVNCWVGARVEEEGAIAVPARTLIDLVSAFPPDRVDLEGVVRTMTLNLNCGRSEANIKGMDAVEFPPVPVPEGTGNITLDADLLRTAISQVAFSAATDEARPILTGVLVSFEGNQLTMAAADGYRLAVRTASFSEPVSEPFSVIVPARALQELGRVSSDEEDAISATVTPDHNRILFEMTDVVLTSQLIPGNFPDYEQIIPKDLHIRVVVSTSDLLKACRTAQIFARDGSNIIQLHVHPETEVEPGRLVVSATSAETGDDVTALDATIEGEAVDIAFNVKYLIDVLTIVDAPQVSLDVASSSRPGVFRPVGQDEYLYVVMPMHLGR